MKDLKLCSECNNNSGKNKPLCQVCQIKKDKYDARKRIGSEKRRLRLKAEGKCICCREKEVVEKSNCCASCRDKLITARKEKEESRIMAGLCKKCGKEPPRLNKQFCTKCALYDIKLRKKFKDIVYNYYGGYKCNCCGETEELFLTIDHINNDGSKQRKKIKEEGGSLYPWIIKNNFPDDLQILCMNCQLGKKVNGGICPHKEII